jgi:hypothetical protein
MTDRLLYIFKWMDQLDWYLIDRLMLLCNFDWMSRWIGIPSTNSGFSGLSISISSSTDVDGWSESVSSDDSTIISCLFFFFAGHSSTMATGSAGGDSLVKSIVESVTLLFPGVSFILNSNSDWVFVTFFGVSTVVKISCILCLLTPLVSICQECIFYLFDLLFLYFIFLHGFLHSRSD